MVVMDTQALDTLGEHAENGVYKDAKIFGVGTSMKSIALLDAGQVQCLVIPDGYGIGYESVEEIEKELTRTFYTLKSHEKEVKVIYKEDLFSDEIERFLYSYEKKSRKEEYDSMVVRVGIFDFTDRLRKAGHKSRSYVACWCRDIYTGRPVYQCNDRYDKK